MKKQKLMEYYTNVSKTIRTLARREPNVSIRKKLFASARNLEKEGQLLASKVKPISKLPHKSKHYCFLIPTNMNIYNLKYESSIVMNHEPQMSPEYRIEIQSLEDGQWTIKDYIDQTPYKAPLSDRIKKTELYLSSLPPDNYRILLKYPSRQTIDLTPYLSRYLNRLPTDQKNVGLLCFHCDKFCESNEYTLTDSHNVVLHFCSDRCLFCFTAGKLLQNGKIKAELLSDIVCVSNILEVSL